jgi:small conductance mechanosensitive channel
LALTGLTGLTEDLMLRYVQRCDPEFAAHMLEPIEIAGVEPWADSAVILRCRMRVRPLQQWNMRREFLRRLQREFDPRGIEIPFPHVTLYAGSDKAGRSPPFRVRHTDGTT